MNEDFKKFVENIVITTIHKQATLEAIDSLHSSKKYKQSWVGGLISLIVITAISVYFSIWWLFIPIGVSYFIYDYVRKLRYVKNKIPGILNEMTLNSIEAMSETLKEDKEDLEIKSNMSLYSTTEIEEKKANITMQEISIDALKTLRKEIKL